MFRLIHSRYIHKFDPAEAQNPDRQAEYARFCRYSICIISLGELSLRTQLHYRNHKCSELAVMSANKRLIFTIDNYYGIGMDLDGNLYHKVNRRDWKAKRDVRFWVRLNSPADVPYTTAILNGTVMQSFLSLINK